MPDIALIVATLKWEGWHKCWDSFFTPDIEPFLIDNSIYNQGVLPSLQLGFENTRSPLLAFIHDDVLAREPWFERVKKAFDDPKVGLVGFGGALAHGAPDIYKTPYRLQQLGRSSYLSNVDDAEVHGQRFTGSCEVAVLDGYAMIVRREILQAMGGWPLDTPIGYIAYDYWLCCATHLLGYKIQLEGIQCHHFGGRSAVFAAPEYRGDFEAAHRYIYDTFQKVLPWDVSTR